MKDRNAPTSARFALLLAAAALLPACDEGVELDDERVQFRNPCLQEGVESYYDGNGDEIICGGNTEVPGWPPDPEPEDPQPSFCEMFPEVCFPPPDDPPPPPEDPPPGGGEPGLPMCTENSDIPADFQQKADSKVADCFNYNWAAQPFVEQTDTVNYSPGSGGVLYSIGDWLTANVTACVIQNIDWLLYSGSVGGQVMQGMINRLNQQASEKNLTPHQRMCSAMCVSSRLISYSVENFSGVLPSSSVAAGAGVCREFAQIGERLLDGMGFSSSVAGSLATQHAFIDVTSPEGGSFYMEPQSSSMGNSCVFYNRH